MERKTTILITGGAGFIGSSLASRLIRNKNCRIIIVDNFDNNYDIELKKKNIAPFTENPNVILNKIDIRDKKALDKIFGTAKIDCVIHLAGKAGVRASFLAPEEYEQVNVNGTENILECMKKYNVKKLIFASSSSIYGNAKEEIFSEDIKDLKPISPYAETKKRAEEIIKTYSEENVINAVCLRFFTVYGRNQRPDLAIHKFIKLIMNDEEIPFYGDGKTSRDYTHIDDILDGICSAIKYDKTSYEIINLGSQSPITLQDLVKLIEKLLGKKAKIKKLPPQKGDVNKTYADISKAKRLLGYQPHINFEDGLKDFIKSLKE